LSARFRPHALKRNVALINIVENASFVFYIKPF